MANSFVRYTGNGSTTAYAIPFSYRLTTDIVVKINGVTKTVTTHYTYNAAGTQITFGTAPTNGDSIEIRRTTSQTSRLTDYASGSVLTENDLDTDSTQGFFMSQEAIDDANDKIVLDTTDFQWDAGSKRIKNVSNPTSNQDVATKHYIENTWLSPANKTALTTINANIANINAVNSNATNINAAVANATNINTVATNIGSVNTVATDIAKVIAVANDLAEAVSEVETVADDLNETTSEIDTVASSISNVDAVGTNITNVNTVAGISSNVTTVAGISSAVTGVNNIASAVSAVNSNTTNINTVSGNNSNISTVAGISANVTSVANISSDVTAVAGKATEIGRLGTTAAVADMAILGTADVVTDMNILATADIVTDMNLLATSANVTNMATLGASGVVGNIATVAGISGNVTTVAGISANVSTVAGISANVSTAATNAANITTVASNIANVNTVGGAISNVNSVGGSIANVNTVATNLAAVNNFANVYRISSSAPTSSLDVGDLYFDTSANELKVYKASGWAAAGSSVNGTSQRFHYDITGTPTTVSGSDANGNTLAYDAGFVDVYLNGIRMTPADITVTSGTSVVFAQALAAGDDVDIVAYGTFNIAAMNASNLNSGTVPDARITGTYTGLTGLDLTDNSKIRLGTGNDLEIYHDGSNSYIRDTGTGALRITGSMVRLNNAADSAIMLSANEGSSVDLYHNGTKKAETTASGFKIESGGSSGVSLNSNADELFIQGATAGLTIQSNNGEPNTIAFGDVSDSDVGKLIYDHSANAMTFTTNTSERMRITSDGKVGIGTTSPSQMLDISGTNPVLSFIETDQSNKTYNIGSFGGAFAVYDSTAGAYRMIVENGGNVVFNEGGSDCNFRIESDSNANMFKLDAGNNAIGIGSDPISNSMLHIKQASSGQNSVSANSEEFVIEDDDNCGMTILSGTGNTGTISFGDSGDDNIGQVQYHHAENSLKFVVGANERFRVTQHGAFGINTTSPTAKLHTITADTTEQAAKFDASSGSYGGDGIVRIGCARANTTSYEFMRLGSSNFADVEYLFRGDGNAYADNSWNGGGADYGEYFEWKDGNSSDEDRRGYPVILDGNKIVKATDSDDASKIIGIISGNPAIVGDGAYTKWNDKYQKDDFGTYLRDENGERLLNTDYDETKDYVPRENRNEWDVVGLMGKLRLRKGQPTGTNWIKMRDISDSVEEWLVR